MDHDDSITPDQVLSNIRSGRYLPLPPDRPTGLSLREEVRWLQQAISEQEPSRTRGLKQFRRDLWAVHRSPLHIHENVLTRAWKYASVDPTEVDRPDDLVRVATVYDDLITALFNDPYDRGQLWALVYAVGETPEAALHALGKERGWNDLTRFEDLSGGDPERFSWGRTFLADGTSMKAAGRGVPGGYMVTWVK